MVIVFILVILEKCWFLRSALYKPILYGYLMLPQLLFPILPFIINDSLNEYRFSKILRGIRLLFEFCPYITNLLAFSLMNLLHFNIFFFQLLLLSGFFIFILYTLLVCIYIIATTAIMWKSVTFFVNQARFYIYLKF